MNPVRHLEILILIPSDAAIRTDLDENNLLVAICDAVVDLLTDNGFGYYFVITQLRYRRTPLMYVLWLNL